MAIKYFSVSEPNPEDKANFLGFTKTIRIPAGENWKILGVGCFCEKGGLVRIMRNDRTFSEFAAYPLFKFGGFYRLEKTIKGGNDLDIQAVNDEIGKTTPIVTVMVDVETTEF